MDKFIEVTKEKFYSIIGPLDVSPYPNRDLCLWKLRGGKEIGRSSQGYVPKYGGQEKYYILKEYLERKSN
jgi:hypothetical protein